MVTHSVAGQAFCKTALVEIEINESLPNKFMELEKEGRKWTNDCVSWLL